ncbi:unnamed protein product [Mesocestoides corti]|uniref:Uncharacterized protein n=1 Tax=Mesocestoides corti TaxID=53468 RepID=A0A0R3U2G9_MESCO|nr:unnamed protein product [Mesocestoides corti]
MTISILFDIICSRLPRVPFIKTLFLVFGYFGGYAAYTEFLITKQNFYTYPILRNFDVRGRYYFYAVNLSVVLIVFLLSVMIIRVGSTEQKRKTKKDKTKNKKNQQPPKQTRAVPTVGALAPGISLCVSPECNRISPHKIVFIHVKSRILIMALLYTFVSAAFEPTFDRPIYSSLKIPLGFSMCSKKPQM